MSKIIKEWYDTHADYEWIRLFQDGYHQLEFLITMHFLEKYLPPKGLILDAGGGPGRYTIELARKGYNIALLDLSTKCLEIARKQIGEAGLEDRIKEIVEGSIVDLSMFQNDRFDAVLCLGPFSHLLEGSDRERAARELVRVARRGAPLFISAINRYGLFRTILQRLPEELIDPSHSEIFTKGIYRAHFRLLLSRSIGTAFTDTYFFIPNELKDLIESKGVQTMTVATCQGLSSNLKEATNKLYQDQEKWKVWWKILLKTCTDPCITGLGEHFLYVGKKTRVL